MLESRISSPYPGANPRRPPPRMKGSTARASFSSIPILIVMLLQRRALRYAASYSSGEQSVASPSLGALGRRGAATREPTPAG